MYHSVLNLSVLSSKLLITESFIANAKQLLCLFQNDTSEKLTILKFNYFLFSSFTEFMRYMHVRRHYKCFNKGQQKQ